MREFPHERAMMPPASAAALALLVKPSETWVVLREHLVQTRIPDLVLGRLNVKAVRSRLLLGQTRPLGATEIRLLRALRPDRPTTTQTAARHGQVTVATAQRVLHALQLERFCARSPQGGYVRLVAPVPLLDRILTLEVKKSEWRRALLQARAHQMFADGAYVAFDAKYAARFVRAKPAFVGLGIGMISLRADGEFKCVSRGRRSGLKGSVAATLGGERALARLLGLAPSSLPEARLPGGSARTADLEQPELVGPQSRTLERLLGAASRSLKARHRKR